LSKDEIEGKIKDTPHATKRCLLNYWLSGGLVDKEEKQLIEGRY